MAWAQPAALTTCHRTFLEARCRERGYTLDEVMPCVVAQDGDEWTVDTNHAAYPHRRQGLGDMVAAGLGAIGITKERVSALVDGDCGCAERQRMMNKWGAKYLGIGHLTPSDPLDA